MMKMTRPKLSRQGLKLLLLLAVSAALVSCETVNYYSQAARGQLAIVFGRHDIEELLGDEELDPILRDKFEEVLAIREFAGTELGLPVRQNYSSYVEVGREHVVWNVFAAPEFSTDPVNWCFPIAGCVAYRGYFSEAAATRFAQSMVEEGYDVYTGGVDAYSTLGWFEDPVLSTVMRRANYQLAGLIFHELAHQVVYVPGDTTFNESFATAVEREGLRRWLLARNQAANYSLATTDRQRQQQFIDLVISYRDRLQELYASESAAAEMRRAKSELQAQLRRDYGELKLSWGGYAGYDAWFQRPLNNAQLSTVSSYNDLVPFFDELLVTVENDVGAFFARVREIAALSEAERAVLTGSEE